MRITVFRNGDSSSGKKLGFIIYRSQVPYRWRALPLASPTAGEPYRRGALPLAGCFSAMDLYQASYAKLLPRVDLVDSVRITKISTSG